MNSNSLLTHSKIQTYSSYLRVRVLEIPNFLTDEECEGIIERTRKQGLYTSHVHIDPESREYEKKTKELIGM